MDSNILNQNNFKFNKKYGQNFIFDKNLLTAIVNDSKIDNQDEVLEIGPGAGTLTKIIAEKCKKVVSYEIDENLKPILQEELKDTKNSIVIFKDALKEDIKEIEKNFNGEYSIIANLPYYITTPLIFKFIEQTNKVKKITVMVQKEVAERLVSKPRFKEYGIITIILDFYGNVKLKRSVPRRMFIPSPNVDSSIIEIEIVPNKFDCDAQNFIKVVHSAFAMRRKTLANNLSQTFNLTKDKINEMLTLLGFLPTVRAEELSTKDYVNLTKILFDTLQQN